MLRTASLGLLLILPFSGWRSLSAQSVETPAPKAYELMINGESFLVEADRQTRLESKEKPGTTYNVALRVAVEQPMELNSVRFDYDWPAQVQDDRGRQRRTVRIQPELGYTLLVTDLGQPLDSKDREEALRIVSDSVIQGLKESGMENVEASATYEREFARAKALGTTIRYKDKENLPETCLVFLFTGDKFACSCVIQYIDANGETILPRVKTMLDSVRPRR